MLINLQEMIKQQLQTAVARIWEIELPLKDIAVEYPPKIELGDLAFPLAFELAKRLKAQTGTKQNPRQLAEQLRQVLVDIVAVAKVETAGAGYLNVFFDRAYLLQQLTNTAAFGRKSEKLGKLIVEHTSINPNKAAHIGHVRNAVLGDTVARMLRASGEIVEVHNYIDNTGVQVADVVVGFKYLENKSLAEVMAITEQFDYYCWDLYAKVGKFYEQDPANQQLRTNTLHEIEQGQGETAILAEHVAQRILRCHLNTMWRLGIRYDVLPRESEVLHLHFWATAFELLQAQDAIYYETEGKNKGCWVMRSEIKPQPEVEDPSTSERSSSDSAYDADKILVRSNGTVTYTGKDIAYHLWKLGILGLDFAYTPFYRYADGHLVWITTSEKNVDRDNPTLPHFGRGVAYINVIDVGQSYPQTYVKLGVKLLTDDARVERSTHLAYEKVALTPASAKELGYELSEADSKRSQISMSGRKGLGVKADDLIDRLEARALAEVQKRHPETLLTEQTTIAHQLAVGALRYFLLKYTRNSVIAFDFDEALAFEGETGPYIQYAVVRISGIFRKLAEENPAKAWTAPPTAAELAAFTTLLQLQEAESGWNGHYLWSLIYQAGRLEDVLRIAVNLLEPTYIAKYAHQLAGSFNEFYNAKSQEGKPSYKLVAESDPNRKRLLVILTAYVQQQLQATLQLLGIEVPDKM
jgi:arginyl-tRNA synthetase